MILEGIEPSAPWLKAKRATTAPQDLCASQQMPIMIQRCLWVVFAQFTSEFTPPGDVPDPPVPPATKRLIPSLRHEYRTAETHPGLAPIAYAHV